MCLFYADFKHFHETKPKIFHSLGKVSSIISANESSIMRSEAMPVRDD
jgi:hypothetical protein